MEKLVTEIAADLIAKGYGKTHNYTVETLVANWRQRIEWLGLKVGGKAWRRELLLAAKNGWIATSQETTVFIPPSEETLAWGGFLGGEFVHPKEMQIAAEQAFYQRFPSAA